MRGKVILLGGLLAAACNPNRELDTRTYDSIQVMERAVDRTVKDPVRAEKTKTTLQEVEASIKAYYDALAKLRSRAYEVARNYDSTQADFTRILDRMSVLRRTHRDELIGLAMRARATTTEQEWAAITDELLEKKMLKR